MADKENKRKCFKCGSSPIEDAVKLFRFAKPGIRNLLRCEQWAKYMFPDGEYSSIEFQRKLYSEHRVLCERHFKDDDFTDETKKLLLRTAVPCDVEHELPIYGQPGPSQRIPFANSEMSRSSETQKNAEKEKTMYSKCTKHTSCVKKEIIGTYKQRKMHIIMENYM